MGAVIAAVALAAMGVGLAGRGGLLRSVASRVYRGALRQQPAPTRHPIPLAEPSHAALAAAAARAGSGDVVARAEIDGALAREAFTRADRVAQAWLTHRDPNTGLLPRARWGGASMNLWNSKDVAADLFGHLVNEAYLLAPEHFSALTEILATERARAEGLPVAIDLNTGATIAEDDLTRSFGAVEYAKDGLLSIVELNGATPYRARLEEVVNAIAVRAAVPSRFGPLPSRLAEKNGELLQVLARVAVRPELVELGRRIADAYTEEVLPGNGHIPAHEWDFTAHGSLSTGCRLRDHGNEAIAGLVEWTLAERRRGDPRAAERSAVVEAMLDRLLDVGRDRAGLWRNWVSSKGAFDPRRERTFGLNDNWGYLTSAYVAWALALPAESPRRQRYMAEARRTLAAVAAIHGGLWQAGEFDGYADAIEGMLYLLPFLPDAAAQRWVDEEAGILFAYQRPDGLVEGQYLDGNFVRTALLYGLSRSAGVRPVPWQPQLAVGAVRDGEALTLVASAAERPWQGVLRFDTPRHRTNLGLGRDYPRLNGWPEWFVVATGDRCEVTDLGSGAVRIVDGAELAAGLPAALEPGAPLRLRVRVLARGVSR